MNLCGERSMLARRIEEFCLTVVSFSRWFRIEDGSSCCLSPADSAGTARASSIKIEHMERVPAIAMRLS
eukprot:CAMPEP_0170595586 /NCGR_PEP_ID=MMETSP0224-20130122/14645_1 /TAXON_ID=285029 /ORGANISM="Togula jolla, Strain CCCM 725" /LENGTH=68 /DNA_ID=CAMNT_0010919785 /DNA_START=23 /DNA_END=229 /DNA_ORIENTATION=-